MKILFAYLAEAVRPESMACMQAASAAGHDVRFRELHGPLDYWAAMREMFAEGSAFLNIEHDIAITQQQIVGIEVCDQPVCAFGYGMIHEGDIPPALEEWTEASARRDHEGAVATLAGQVHGRYCLGLGATKFSTALVQSAAPGILASRPVNWKWLEFGLQAHFPEHVGKYHHHLPDVEHW